MYADHITDSIKSAVTETERRRKKQIQYNKKNQITPKSIIKSIPERKTADLETVVDTKSMARAVSGKTCSRNRSNNEKIC